ncbi:hypothetical protein AGOR_G00003840, partial [Albula goreensis]
DGRPQWEVDAKIVREKSQGSTIVVEVPPYHSKALTSAVQVQFYVCNGKRKRSQSQRFTYLSVLVKQEHRDELDMSPAPTMPLPLPLAHPGRTQLPSPDQGHPHDSLLSSSPRGLLPSMPPPQPAYSPMAASFQHLPHLPARGLNTASDCQLIGPPLAFHSALPPPARPSYQAMQQSLPYNGQPSLPMSAVSTQAYERMPFQPDPASSHPLGMGMVYHSPTSATLASSTPPSASSQSLAHASSHLHSLGYPCPNPVQVTSPTHPRAQPTPQLQHALGYHSTGQRSASCPSPTNAPLPMVPSPHSGPSSPQLHSLPYQSPNAGPASSPSPTSSSPLVHLPHSGQPSPQAASPGMASLPSVSPLVHPMAGQTPFPPEGERLNIKQEPEDKELTFHAIGLQDITLDDVNEIIGRDMSQSPGSHGPTAAHGQS